VSTEQGKHRREICDTSTSSVPHPNGQTTAALAHIANLVLDGLRHGFFDCSINCEIGAGGKRHLLIRAGKSHKFIIPEDDLLN
jgi:hypothetical protein